MSQSSIEAVSSFLGAATAPAEGDRPWLVHVFDENNELSSVIDAAKVIVVNETLDVAVGVGQRPEGYMGPIIREAKGGGEVSLPYFEHPDTGTLWVGLLMESRPNMGGPTLCVVGGMNSATTTRDEQMIAEGEEEGGFTAAPEILSGALINSNRLFILANPSIEEGVRVGVIEVPFTALTFEDGITTEAHFAPGTEFGKKPGAVIFKPWMTAISETADALALSAIARLLAHRD